MLTGAAPAIGLTSCIYRSAQAREVQRLLMILLAAVLLRGMHLLSGLLLLRELLVSLSLLLLLLLEVVLLNKDVTIAVNPGGSVDSKRSS